jgi:NAD(P)-dependent dehydrogenase (short-subunit alcohol dehydrogenase family)
MKLTGKVAVVTGGASGIGAALCRRFAAEGARAVVVADFNAAGTHAVALEIGASALAIPTDVRVEPEIVRLVAQTIERCGPIDLFCSNAGIAIGGGEGASDDDWQRIWEVNLMAHVYAARAVLPAMLARGEGYLLNTASAAGLLTQADSAPYSVTKHAAVSFAEWLAIAYGDRGIRVSCLCPQGVRTPMLMGAGRREGVGGFLQDGSISPEELAEAVVVGLAEEKFLILPHPEVLEYMRRKTGDYDRWLRGMRRFRK